MSARCVFDTDNDGNCPVHPDGCPDPSPVAVEARKAYPTPWRYEKDGWIFDANGTCVCCVRHNGRFLSTQDATYRRIVDCVNGDEHAEPGIYLTLTFTDDEWQRLAAVRGECPELNHGDFLKGIAMAFIELQEAKAARANDTLQEIRASGYLVSRLGISGSSGDN